MSLTPVTADVGSSRAKRQALVPQLAQPLRLVKINAATIAAIHLAALLAFVPWFFSWTGLVVAFLGLYVFGTLGISLCFHRLLTHRSLACPKWLEHSLAILGLCCVQDTPARWVGIHRRHHEHADEQPDPHRPLAGFLWAHIGWIIYRNRDLTRLELLSRYSKDIIRDPFYARLEQNFRWVWIVLISWLCFFASGCFIELLLRRNVLEAVQFGFSVLIWGVFVRTVLVWHVSWAINSVTHLWGYRNYETSDSSRNNVLIGLLSNGEGWHNNHHAHPQSARHGLTWYEVDLNWYGIQALRMIGLAWDVKVQKLTPSGNAKAPVPPVLAA